MDLASVVAALASVGVRVSGSTPNSSVQVDSSRACPTGLAGPEPSGTINDPGQHFQSCSGSASVPPPPCSHALRRLTNFNRHVVFNISNPGTKDFQVFSLRLRQRPTRRP